MRALILGLLGLVTAPGLTTAQGTTSQDAHCIQGQFNWMFNSLNQDPCTVAQDLGQVCNSGYQIPPVATDQVYLGPTVAGANECRCSSVVYSLLSACALCQDAGTIVWDQYDQNCSAVYVAVFIPQIPAGTAVPHWAYMNVTIYDEFNLTYAQGLVGPESTTNSHPTATSSPSSSSSSSSSHKPSIVGPVVGAVVGVVTLALISVAVILLLRSRRKQAVSTLNPGEPLPENKAEMVYPMYAVPPQDHAPLLYDPSDPRTFPPTPPPHWPMAPEFSTVSGESIQPTTTGSSLATRPPRYYTGAPEL